MEQQQQLGGDVWARVFDFLGPMGRYLQLSSVNSEWRALYAAALTEQQQQQQGQLQHHHLQQQQQQQHALTAIRLMVASEPLLQWAFANGCPKSKRILCYIVDTGASLGTAECARAAGCRWGDVMLYAAKRGREDILEWARSGGCPVNPNIANAAATQGAIHGHVAVLKWARGNGATLTHIILDFAAMHGHLACLRWLRAEGTEWDVTTCAFAAHGGHLEILQWARANGAPWDALTCAKAAEGGHLELLQWARLNGAPWDADTCLAASRGGYLHVLKWAREQGCPWVPGRCLAATASAEIREYIVATSDYVPPAHQVP
ncbi:hypothetical protein JKP88DRAFT_320541 [Tribonema minus]|uniref:Uncharacterized protein n=1 Tax=Tribonema minus TaxID=303371 RepID=A0A835YW89_9STRA|nr:hypothetical protein JKP88DRAFT_320541 [Tribonema minus]